MRFVLANRLLNLAGGTEVHLVTVGTELLRLGHEVVIYSPEVGPFAEHVRERGIEVVTELDELPVDCDVALAQDGFVVYDLVERYPGRPSSFASAAIPSTFSCRRKSRASRTSSSSWASVTHGLRVPAR